MVVNTLPPLAVTPGEPAGIGPECVLRYRVAHPEVPLVAVADASMLRRCAQSLAFPLEVRSWNPGQRSEPGVIDCLPIALPTRPEPGAPNPANAGYVLETLRAAVELVRSGDAAGLVTGPVHKGVINDAGISFSGHTEFLAQLAGVERVVMMLAADALRVALVTTHLPLSAVPEAITPESVGSAIRVTVTALREQFGISRPRLQVLGLNPHAGEGGHLGHEDDAVIAPAMAACADAGAELLGPVPADSAFTPSALARCDAVLAMYHDQGLPVLKHAGFGRAVNITLGLPFVRTSVDHGTALDIAGKGVADSTSFGHAMTQARDLVAAST